jgi:hypothetical protein
VLEGTTRRTGIEGMDGLFSVEMESKKHVRSISISNEAHDRVLFEGDLGRVLSFREFSRAPAASWTSVLKM